jgi:hypothetical protein
MGRGRGRSAAGADEDASVSAAGAGDSRTNPSTMVASASVISSALNAESKVSEYPSSVMLPKSSSQTVVVVLIADEGGEEGGDESASLVLSMWMDSSGLHEQNGMLSSKVKETRLNIERCSVVAYRTCERAPKKKG